MTDERSGVSPGDAVGWYRVEELLGSGGMGLVYRARHVHLDRVVALKVISPGLASDPDARRRFTQEARSAASVLHPHVVPVFDAGEASGVLYLAMELIDGVDLGKLLRTDGPMPPRRAVAIVAQLASALDSAHEHGLVHRDVKPENVMLSSREGRDHAYLTDFGLAKVLRGGASASTPGHTLRLGTYGYISPEQISGDPVDGRADVYALGALLFTILTGRSPDDGGSPPATIVRLSRRGARLSSDQRSDAGGHRPCHGAAS